MTHIDQWRLFQHEISDYYGQASLTKLKYSIHSTIIQELVADLQERGTRSLRILDVGCAQGFYTISLAERGHRTYGLEINSWFISYARLKDDHHVANFVRGSGYAIPFRSESFDLVILGEIVEHIAEPEILIKEARRVLGNAGGLIITTPNGKSLLSKLPSYHNRGDLSSLRHRECGPDAEDHLFLFRPDEMMALLRDEGMTIITRRYGKTWLFNKHSFALMKRLPASTALLADRLLTLWPWGPCSAEGMFFLAQRAKEYGTRACVPDRGALPFTQASNDS